LQSITLINKFFRYSESTSTAKREGRKESDTCQEIPVATAILVLWSIRKGDLAHTHWILISLFIIFNGIGDIGFGYGAVLGTIGKEEWIWNMFFYAGYLTLASALFWQSRYIYSSSIIVRDNNDNVKENISNY
jgi:hypothetical protein